MQKLDDTSQLNTYATLDSVRQRLREKGLTEPRRPTDELEEVPKDFMTRGAGYIIELYQRYEAHYEYVAYQQTLNELTEEEWKSALNNLLAALRKKGLDKDDLEIVDDVVAVRRALQIHHQEEAFWARRKSDLDRRMKLVSRAVEAIKVEWQASARAGNAGYPGDYVPR